jgi:hypothetical protein
MGENWPNIKGKNDKFGAGRLEILFSDLAGGDYWRILTAIYN